MSNQHMHPGQDYYTSGQVAKLLRVSVSTLKRWLSDDGVLPDIKENSNGWKLFSPDDIDSLRQFQRQKRKQGKTFSDNILRPVDK